MIRPRRERWSVAPSRRRGLWTIALASQLLATTTGASVAGSAGTASASIAPLDGPYPSCFTGVSPSVPGCSTAKLVYDSAAGYGVALMLDYEGSDAFTSSTWTYSGGTWTNVTGTDGPNPPGLVGGGFVWDPMASAAILFGGFEFPTAVGFGATWEFQGGRWTNLSTPSPAPSGALETSAAYDAATGAVVALWQSPAHPAAFPSTPGEYRDGTWSNLTAGSGPVGAVGYDPAVASDPPQDGLLFFGGFNTTSYQYENQTWRYANGGFTLQHPTRAPPARSGDSLVYDAGDGYALLAGGWTTECGQFCPFATDQWTFAGGDWTNVTGDLQGSPPIEADGQLVDDTGANVLIEGFGVANETSTGAAAQTTLYEYSNETWTVIEPPSGTAAFPWTDLLVGLGFAAAVVIAVRVARRARRP